VLVWLVARRAKAVEAALKRVQVAPRAAEAAQRRVPVALKKKDRNRTSLWSRKRSPLRNRAEAVEAGQRNSAGCTKRSIGSKKRRK